MGHWVKLSGAKDGISYFVNLDNALALTEEGQNGTRILFGLGPDDYLSVPISLPDMEALAREANPRR